MSISHPRQVFSFPSVPFAGTILGGLEPGEMVLIQGSVPADADRFQVDLTCGSSVKPRADVLFHFNPRINKSSVVCNTLTAEKWGREQILHTMPFRPGAAFELLILALEDKFKVAVNGSHLLEYQHRQELQRVDTICISGRVEVQAVGVVPPAAVDAPPAAAVTQDSETLTSAAGDLDVPFRARLDGGLSVGRSVVIRAEVRPGASSFCVNLSPASGSSIALHLNPRLNKKVFVRNSFLSGCWGPEETRLAGFPFTPGRYFEMIVLCDPHHFRVAVNGDHQVDYQYRVQDLSSIDQVEVLGDLVLTEVRVVRTGKTGKTGKTGQTSGPPAL
ncbi:galectin-8-like [Cololabis saira]|uniref:galectin-8-like n=1 Tax=Cololabis saira TaxID=129043 RepID=UPI002AD4EC01|nr:galectin-8-like [Cololabis saira]